MQTDRVESPNFNARRHALDMLVLHYTGMESGEAALQRMCDPAAEVSAHYMVWEDGRITQLVQEDQRAWHAGVSRWQDDDDLNSRSIGIEIVNGGHDVPLPNGRLPPYPDAQIAAVIALSKDILSRHAIRPSRIVGHSDIAPARKIDPGEHFPWDRLAAEELKSAADEIRGKGAFLKLEAGMSISGKYECPVDLAQGRFALVTRSKEFTLVPWRPELERYRGSEISVKARAGGIDWSVGRARGIGW